jgi:serine/threonine-protein kinase
VVVVVVILGVIGGGWYLLGPGTDSEQGPAQEPTTPYEHYQAGMAALRISYRSPEQMDRAEDHFRRALALDARYATAYAALAQLYWRRFRFSGDAAWLDQAMSNANRALDLNDQLTFGRATRGLILSAQGEREAAREEFEKVLTLDPTNADAHRGLGDYYRVEDDTEAAEAAYQEAIRLRPEDAELHTALGALLYDQARYPQAEAAFRKALEIDPEDADGHGSLAAVYHMQGNYPEAAASLQEALQIRPNARSYANLGTLYFFQGLYQEALTAYQKAIESGANNYIIWGNLGDAYRWTPGNHEKSREAFEIALRQLEEKLAASPQDTSWRALRALYLAKMEEGERALAELAQLEAGEKPDAVALFNATLAAEIAGNRDLALSFLRQALVAGYSLVEIRGEPELAKLREDPRFHYLVSGLS